MIELVEKSAHWEVTRYELSYERKDNKTVQMVSIILEVDFPEDTDDDFNDKYDQGYTENGISYVCLNCGKTSVLGAGFSRSIFELTYPLEGRFIGFAPDFSQLIAIL